MQDLTKSSTLRFHQVKQRHNEQLTEHGSTLHLETGGVTFAGCMQEIRLPQLPKYSLQCTPWH
jgi:hypothetical protein